MEDDTQAQDPVNSNGGQVADTTSKDSGADDAVEAVDENLVNQDVDPADVEAEDKVEMTEEVAGEGEGQSQGGQ